MVFDENVLEKDALQLNISWKSADLGGKLKRKQHIIFGLNVDYGLYYGQWRVNPRRKLALVWSFTFSTKLYFAIQIRWEAYVKNSNKRRALTPNLCNKKTVMPIIHSISIEYYGPLDRVRCPLQNNRQYS